MFRVIDLSPDGKLQVRDHVEDVAPPGDGTLRWIDLQGDGQEGQSLERLLKRMVEHGRMTAIPID